MPGRTYTPPSDKKYRFGFNGKENDTEYGATSIQDYGFRIYNPSLAKFLSVDPLTKSYPMLTPYQFASNTPIQAIDLDGLEAFYIHGTWATPTTFPKITKTTMNEIFCSREGETFQWSSNNSDAARQEAARDLASHVAKYRDPNQPLTLVGHSHGGNVAILAANILEKEYEIQVDNIVTINTPVREYQLNESVTAKHFNIWHQGDPVQTGGGADIIVPDDVIVVSSSPNPLIIPVYLGGLEFPKGELGTAGSLFDNAYNIEADGGYKSGLFGKVRNFGNDSYHDSHTKPGTWADQLRKAVNFKVPEYKIMESKPLEMDNTRTNNSSSSQTTP